MQIYVFLLPLMSPHSRTSWVPIFTLFCHSTAWAVYNKSFYSHWNTCPRVLVRKYSSLDCNHPAHQHGLFPFIYKTSCKDSLVFILFRAITARILLFMVWNQIVLNVSVECSSYQWGICLNHPFESAGISEYRVCKPRLLVLEMLIH